MTERLSGLLAYLNELSKISDQGEYICIKEIAECIGWIREELCGDSD